MKYTIFEVKSRGRMQMGISFRMQQRTRCGNVSQKEHRHRNLLSDKPAV